MKITPQTLEMTFHPSYFIDTEPTSSALSMLRASEKTADTIFKVFSMSRPGIDPHNLPDAKL